MTNSFDSHGTLEVDGRTFKIASLKALEAKGFDLQRLPYALKILLENLLRREDGESVPASDIEAVANWKPNAGNAAEIAYMPARVLLQDFTGVPAVVDLAAMRDAMAALGGDPTRIEPLQPAELVIDHSVQVDVYASPDAVERNTEIEFERNRERYLFLRWGQSAFGSLKVVPPNTGICHQVNLEYLARGVMGFDEADGTGGWAYPDTVVGTDSHTTMVNGLGVLGWGVGGIEAEAAMLGQPVTMLIPEVVGYRLVGELAEGATATDLVLTIVQRLREKGVVGKFVEFFGDGLDHLTLADRATISNMAPEYGATCGIFPIDTRTLEYMRLTGRSEAHLKFVEAYAKEQGLFRVPGAPEATYSDVLELDLASVEPCLAGPKRPQDRLGLGEVRGAYETLAQERRGGGGGGGTAVATKRAAKVEVRGQTATLEDGAVTIAAITSCTNTSNPGVLLAAGLVAKKANALGIRVKPWVKTSLAPGSKVVTDYLAKAGLLSELEAQGFGVVGYGCTTCIGNSGPLPESVSKAISENDMVVASVISGNRNFEGRVHSQVLASFLASPPLVVAYALAGRVDFDPRTEPLGKGKDGKDVFLRDVWPTTSELADLLGSAVQREQFEARYANVYEGPEAWRALDVPSGATYAWDESSTYVKSPPFFEGMGPEPDPVTDITGARCLVLAGDSITTDHISPAGSIAPESPAGKWLAEQGVAQKDFNSYGSRRGNHEVMMRGTFANVRFKNKLTPGVEGSSTLHLPSGEAMSIFDASERYRAEGVPTIVLAGKEYGTGSSRDWAGKGPALLGVRVVIAESFERIHRSNLIGMGVLPLQFKDGESAESLGLTGRETFDVLGVAELVASGAKSARVRVTSEDGASREIEVVSRLDTPKEAEYYRHGGILQYVLRRLVAS